MVTAQADVRSKIIEAAQARFLRYGYGKTTMAEIAKDCDMSAANLYRYFANKEDIGQEIGRRCLSAKEDALRAALEASLPAAVQLEAFVLANLRYVHAVIQERPHIAEIVESICKVGSDAMTHHQAVYLALMGTILEAGNRSGEFDVPDLDSASELIQTATVAFAYPPLIANEGRSLEELEARARAMVALLVRGLAKR